MSVQESAWLAWYMCAVSLMMTALGLLFLIASQFRGSAPVFDYWLLNTVIAVSFSPVGAIIAPRLPPRNPIGWLFCAIGLFGQLRNETDLDALSDELVSVVRETMQPEHASLWLRSPGRRARYESEVEDV